MGRDIQAIKISGEDRRKYRDKVRRSLDAFARMLRERRFDENPSTVGQEIELNLTDEHGMPAMRNAAALEAIASPAWDTEVGQFNLEINVPPRMLDGDALDTLETELRADLNAADARARTTGSHLVMVGILPTLAEHDVHEDSMSANERYKVLNEQIFAARGEDMRIEIDGAEQLLTHMDSITPESACTSVQLHVQVSPDSFANYWNAAQSIAGVQVALAANSPFLFGRRLWHETRITLFEQATDTRSDELKEQGVRPRVWFGERWITSVFDLFEENLRYFPALLPICEDEDPLAMLDQGSSPQLAEMSLHNGTIYRWNRPVYDNAGGTPHLRVENRVLPAGPTIADVVANSAFYYGLVRSLAEAQRPIWTQMSFTTAAENLHEAARNGLDAQLYWPGVGDTPVTELVLRRLLPLAREGLGHWGVDSSCADRLLGIIEQRCLTGQNGAAWQIATVDRLSASGLDRREALRQMTLRYIEHMHSNDPVHSWPRRTNPRHPPRSARRRPPPARGRPGAAAVTGHTRAQPSSPRRAPPRRPEAPRLTDLAETPTMAGSASTIPVSARAVGRSPYSSPASTENPAEATALSGAVTLNAAFLNPRYSANAPSVPPSPATKPQPAPFRPGGGGERQRGGRPRASLTSGVALEPVLRPRQRRLRRGGRCRAPAAAPRRCSPGSAAAAAAGRSTCPSRCTTPRPASTCTTSS